MNNDTAFSDFEKIFDKSIEPEFVELLSTLFQSQITSADNNQIEYEDGTHVPVLRNIPRFVPSDLYTGSFSFQWTNYTSTQLDSAQGVSLTEQDLRNKTGLTPENVKGKLILDAGVGIGRHTEVLARWGAYVVGVDLSDAVETAQQNLKAFPNAVVLQADIGQLPFNIEKFDHIVSIGVLHHTPDTRAFTLGLMPYLKNGGRFSIWLYPSGFARRGEWVPMVSRLPLIAFKDWTEWMVSNARTHRGNHWLEAFIKQFPFSTHHPTMERSALALFDGYTPTFHWTHEPDEVAEWFREAGLDDIQFSQIPTSVSATKPAKSIVKAVPATSNPVDQPFAAPSKLSKLTVEITTLCNLKCAGCPRTTALENGSWEDMHMSLSCFDNILQNLPPVGFVTLHGIGEPTLHPEFNELVAMAKQSGKFQRMKMTTNALARSIQYYEQSVAAGLDEFWISVDSFDQEICNTMRLGTKASKLQRRVKELIEAKLPVHISMVVSADNYMDIPATLEKLYQAGAPPVHMQEFQDFGNPSGLMTVEQRKQFLTLMDQVLPRLPGMTIVPPSYTSPQGDICTAPWFRPAVTVQGYMTPCCTTFDPSLWGFVNISQMSFKNVWEQPGVHQWMSDFVENNTSICRGCGLNPRGFGIENTLGKSGKKGLEQHVVNWPS